MIQTLEQFISWKILLLENSIVGYNSYYITQIILDKYLILNILMILILFVFFNMIQNKKYGVWLFTTFYQWIRNEFFGTVGINLAQYALLFIGIFGSIYLFNLLGLLPYTPCWTTQFFSNLTISFILICGITVLNLDKNGQKFIELFKPQGVPRILIPLLFGLEFLSYWIRILSLSIRLFSNMVAGHSLLHILFDMLVSFKKVVEYKMEILLVFSTIAFGSIYVIFLFEMIVAFLQAYVFSVMFSIYLNDIKLQH